MNWQLGCILIKRLNKLYVTVKKIHFTVKTKQFTVKYLYFTFKILTYSWRLNELQNYSAFDCKTTQFTVNLTVKIRHFPIKFLGFHRYFFLCRELGCLLATVQFPPVFASKFLRWKRYILQLI